MRLVQPAGGAITTASGESHAAVVGCMRRGSALSHERLRVKGGGGGGREQCGRPGRDGGGGGGGGGGRRTCEGRRASSSRRRSISLPDSRSTRNPPIRRPSLFSSSPSPSLRPCLPPVLHPSLLFPPSPSVPPSHPPSLRPSVPPSTSLRPFPSLLPYPPLLAHPPPGSTLLCSFNFHVPPSPTE